MAHLTRLAAGFALILILLLGLMPGTGPAPAAAQTGSSCVELVANGGFETVGVWELGASPAPPQYVSYNRHSGAWSLQLGVPEGGNVQSYSSARQSVSIPAGADRVILTFWVYAVATGAPTTDYMELAILAPDGHTILEKPWFSRTDSRVWNRMDFDLTAWRGRTIQIYFNVYNDGLGGAAQMFLDDVSLAACSTSGGGSGWMTPPLTLVPPPVGATPTPTRGACPKPSLNCGGPATPATVAAAATQPTTGFESPAILTPAPPVQLPAILTPAPPAESPAIIEPAAEAVAPAIIITVVVTAPAEPAIIVPVEASPAPVESPAALVLATPSYWADPVVNGGFEQNFEYWTLDYTETAPLIVTDGVRGGLRAAQLGAVEGVPAGITSVSQEIVVPAGFTNAAVDFWFYPWSQENAGEDYQEAMLISPDGATVARLWRDQSDAREWKRQIIPVSGFTGDPLRLQFSVYNDGAGGSTGMVIDDVSLVALSPIVGEGEDPSGARPASAAVAAPEPAVTRLSLVVTATPVAGIALATVPPASSGGVAAAQELTTPVAAIAAPAPANSSITDRWPKNWWLIPVAAGIIIFMLVLLANDKWRRYWWLALIGIGLIVLVIWLVNRT